jgi:hypothetical protein
LCVRAIETLQLPAGLGTAIALYGLSDTSTARKEQIMVDYLLTNPLVILYVFYLVCMLPVLIWTGSNQPPRRPTVKRPWKAVNKEHRTVLESRFTWPESAISDRENMEEG